MDQYRLFVYGSLRPAAINHSVIESYVDHMEPGSVHGRLYAGADYPYLVLDDAQPLVQGEWVTVRASDYQAALRVLDQFECVRADPAASEYLRVLTSDASTGQRGFIYVAGPAANLHGLPVVDSGDWLTYTRRGT